MSEEKESKKLYILSFGLMIILMFIFNIMPRIAIIDPIQAENLTGDRYYINTSQDNIDNQYSQVVYSSIAGRISDNAVRPIEIDDSTHSISIVDYEHHEIHSGSHFIASYTDGELDAGLADSFLIQTPNTTKNTHIIISISTTRRANITLYEDVNYNGGSPIDVLNNNRNLLNGENTSIYESPIGSGTGRIIYNELMGSATTGQVSGEFSQTRGLHEIILKRNSKYLYRVNSSDDNNRISIVFTWYEHEPKN